MGMDGWMTSSHVQLTGGFAPGAEGNLGTQEPPFPRSPPPRVPPPARVALRPD